MCLVCSRRCLHISVRHSSARDCEGVETRDVIARRKRAMPRTTSGAALELACHLLLLERRLLHIAPQLVQLLRQLRRQLSRLAGGVRGRHLLSEERVISERDSSCPVSTSVPARGGQGGPLRQRAAGPGPATPSARLCCCQSPAARATAPSWLTGQAEEEMERTEGRPGRDKVLVALRQQREAAEALLCLVDESAGGS